MEEDAGYTRGGRTIGDKKKRQMIVLIIILCIVDIALLIAGFYLYWNPDKVGRIQNFFGFKSSTEETQNTGNTQASANTAPTTGSSPPSNASGATNTSTGSQQTINPQKVQKGPSQQFSQVPGSGNYAQNDVSVVQKQKESVDKRLEGFINDVLKCSKDHDSFHKKLEEIVDSLKAFVVAKDAQKASGADASASKRQSEEQKALQEFLDHLKNIVVLVPVYSKQDDLFALEVDDPLVPDNNPNSFPKLPSFAIQGKANPGNQGSTPMQQISSTPPSSPQVNPLVGLIRERVQEISALLSDGTNRDILNHGCLLNIDFLVNYFRMYTSFMQNLFKMMSSVYAARREKLSSIEREFMDAVQAGINNGNDSVKSTMLEMRHLEVSSLNIGIGSKDGEIRLDDKVEDDDNYKEYAWVLSMEAR